MQRKGSDMRWKGEERHHRFVPASSTFSPWLCWWNCTPESCDGAETELAGWAIRCGRVWAANGCCDRNPPGERGGKSRSPPGRPRRSRPAGDTWGRTLAHGRNRQPWRGCTSTSGSERSRKGSARPVTKGQRGVAREERG